MDDEGRAPVLGQAPFAQVEVSDDLDPRNGGRCQIRGNHLMVDKAAVHPQPDPQIVAGRLEMDVRSAAGHGRLESGRNQPRAVALHRLVGDEINRPLQTPLVRDLRPELPQRAEGAFELTHPIRWTGRQQLQIAASCEHQTGQGFVVERIAGGAKERLAGFAGSAACGCDVESLPIPPNTDRSTSLGSPRGLPNLATAHRGIGIDEVVIR